MQRNRMPDTDGFTSKFYKQNWHIIGEETLEAMQQFFATAFMPASVNTTTLFLIPKHPGAARLNEFRQIFCCSTLYELTTRLLASRLKSILQELIVLNQMTFVKDRLLMENVLLAFKLCKITTSQEILRELD